MSGYNSNQSENWRASIYGLYSEEADNRATAIMQQSQREGWYWPQVYYYMVDTLENDFPEVDDSDARQLIYETFKRRFNGRGEYNDYHNYIEDWLSGAYRNYMNVPPQQINPGIRIPGVRITPGRMTPARNPPQQINPGIRIPGVRITPGRMTPARNPPARITPARNNNARNTLRRRRLAYFEPLQQQRQQQPRNRNNARNTLRRRRLAYFEPLLRQQQPQNRNNRSNRNN